MYSPKRIFHVGLANPDEASCVNEACDGKIFWESGADFTYTPAMGTLDMTGQECVFYERHLDKIIDDTCCEFAYFFCQLPCNDHSNV